jgi:hypothetical protein
MDPVSSSPDHTGLDSGLLKNCRGGIASKSVFAVRFYIWTAQYTYYMTKGVKIMADDPKPEGSPAGHRLAFQSLVTRHSGVTRNRRPVGLRRLLGDHFKQRCSDPRDRVYALMVVSTRCKDIELNISYALLVPEAYKNIAQYII